MISMFMFQIIKNTQNTKTRKSDIFDENDDFGGCQKRGLKMIIYWNVKNGRFGTKK